MSTPNIAHASVSDHLPGTVHTDDMDLDLELDNEPTTQPNTFTNMNATSPAAGAPVPQAVQRASRDDDDLIDWSEEEEEQPAQPITPARTSALTKTPTMTSPKPQASDNNTVLVNASGVSEQQGGYGEQDFYYNESNGQANYGVEDHVSAQYQENYPARHGDEVEAYEAYDQDGQTHGDGVEGYNDYEDEDQVPGDGEEDYDEDEDEGGQEEGYEEEYEEEYEEDGYEEEAYNEDGDYQEGHDQDGKYQEGYDDANYQQDHPFPGQDGYYAQDYQGPPEGGEFHPDQLNVHYDQDSGVYYPQPSHPSNEDVYHEERGHASNPQEEYGVPENNAFEGQYDDEQQHDEDDAAADGAIPAFPQIVNEGQVEDRRDQQFNETSHHSTPASTSAKQSKPSLASIQIPSPTQSPDAVPQHSIVSSGASGMVPDVLVLYDDVELPLFERDGETGSGYLDDLSMADSSMRVISDNLKSALRVSSDIECEMKIPELAITFVETGKVCDKVSIRELSNVYIELQRRDGVINPAPLYIHLSLKVKDEDRWAQLQDAVKRGIGLTQLRVQSPGGEQHVLSNFEHNEEDENGLDGPTIDEPVAANSGVEKDTLPTETDDKNDPKTSNISTDVTAAEEFELDLGLSDDEKAPEVSSEQPQGTAAPGTDNSDGAKSIIQKRSTPVIDDDDEITYTDSEEEAGDRSGGTSSLSRTKRSLGDEATSPQDLKRYRTA